MNWSYADLLAAPAPVVDRIVHHLNERATQQAGGIGGDPREPRIEL